MRDRAGKPMNPREKNREGSSDAAERRARRLAHGFGALVCLTFGLIVLGALVRANQAGLACPDWPQCFGTWIPPMDVRVAFEWTHRLVAGAIGLVFVGLAIVTLREPRTRRAAAAPLGLGVLLLATQIVLGGLTVLLQLASWTVTAHLVTGNAFAATLLVIRHRLAEIACPPTRHSVPWPLRFVVFLALGLLSLQLVLGGLVASTYSGLACAEWPTCNGGVWFPTWHGSIGLHLVHRANAYVLFLCLGIAALGARHQPQLARPLAVGLLLATTQLAVGVASVQLAIPVELTGAHSALAAALVLTLAHATREAWPRPQAVSEA